MTNNIILIGMPGSGKSTVGVQLAKYLGLSFIDTDLVIQANQGEMLQDIVNTRGYKALRKIEEQELLKLQLSNDLVSTGGSAVYSEPAMQHLKKQGAVVYLSVSFDEIERRMNATGSEGTRGIAKPEEHTLRDVYNERLPLYKKYADVTIDNNQFSTMEEINRHLKQKNH